MYKHRQNVFNPHQRCGYSESPFARIYFFYTAGSRNGLERVDGKGPHLKKKLNFQAVIKSAASAASPKTKI